MELNLKNDVIFKVFFTKKGNEKYLKSFLESILQERIDKIEVIGEASLEQIKTVQIDTGVENIGEDSFYGCTSLTSITIPNSVTAIGEWSF